jgi:hypothetical protein
MSTIMAVISGPVGFELKMGFPAFRTLFGLLPAEARLLSSLISSSSKSMMLTRRIWVVFGFRVGAGVVVVSGADEVDGDGSFVLDSVVVVTSSSLASS